MDNLTIRLETEKDYRAVEELTREVKKKCTKPLVVKLSPNVTDITEIAKAAEAGGAGIGDAFHKQFHRGVFANNGRVMGLGAVGVAGIVR